MTTFLKRPSLSKPTKAETIPPYTLAFVRARNRNKAHSMLLGLFRDSRMSKRDIAKMLNCKPEQITRWLAGPGNLTLDTISSLAFAMKGEFLSVSTVDELSKPKSNCHSTELLLGDEGSTISVMVRAPGRTETVTVPAVPAIDRGRHVSFAH